MSKFKTTSIAIFSGLLLLLLLIVAVFTDYNTILSSYLLTSLTPDNTTTNKTTTLLSLAECNALNNNNNKNTNPVFSTTTKANSSSSPLSSPSSLSLCQHFPSPFTSSHIWQSSLPRILNASIHPTTPELSLSPEALSNLLKLLKPSLLRRALRTPPSRQSLTPIMKILEAKMNNPKTSPPLQIAVLGGSVTAGRGCLKNSRRISNLACAWPYRFEFLVNQIIGYELIKVHNIAVGGTGTRQGNVFVEYWMYPEELKAAGPDVIVNSYSTNDALPPPAEKNVDPAKYVYDRGLDMLQEFVRSALLSRGTCEPPPLVVHVDDYVGHQQDSVLGELSYNTAMTQISRWYETMAVSYADVVRSSFVYKDTSETTFSPDWSKAGKGKLAVEVHFGMEAHVAISWVLGFSVLEAWSGYCDDLAGEIEESKGGGEEGEELVSIPPPLNAELMFETISSQWTTTMKSKAECANNKGNLSDKAAASNRNPCSLTWLAGPTGYNAQKLTTFMEVHVASITNTGWQVDSNIKDGWSQKVGWIASKIGDVFVFDVGNIKKDVAFVTLFYMKSFTEKWQGSKARITVDVDGDGGDFVEIEGFHSLNTSIAYIEKIQLKKVVRKGEKLRMRVELVGGETFKILGMMFCEK